MTTSFAFSRPLYVMLKPAGARCNMRCTYCYYLEKDKLYGNCANHNLSEELLERFTKEYIESQTSPEIMFTWHGGEALMRPISFYEHALKLQRTYGGGRIIANSIQTNGTLLNEEWCRFLHDNNFLVGISIDGNQYMHDTYRHMANGEKSSWKKVMDGIELLDKHSVEWNAMAVINNINVRKPSEFYRFFRDIGCKYLQFTPIVERITTRNDGLMLAPGMQKEGKLTDFSVTPEQWGEFLCIVFDEWVRRDVGNIFVQIFDATLANWVGITPGLCTLSSKCGHAAVMEHNGDIYSCDHFVYPEHLLGNIKAKTITEMMYSSKQQEFANMKTKKLPRQCKECQYLFACNGECPKNRFIHDRYGNFGLNYLCAGYKKFFEHVAPYMDYMKAELNAGRPPANVMQIVKNVNNS